MPMDQDWMNGALLRDGGRGGAWVPVARDGSEDWECWDGVYGEPDAGVEPVWPEIGAVVRGVPLGRLDADGLLAAGAPEAAVDAVRPLLGVRGAAAFAAVSRLLAETARSRRWIWPQEAHADAIRAAAAVCIPGLQLQPPPSQAAGG